MPTISPVDLPSLLLWSPSGDGGASAGVGGASAGVGGASAGVGGAAEGEGGLSPSGLGGAESPVMGLPKPPGEPDTSVTVRPLLARVAEIHAVVSACSMGTVLDVTYETLRQFSEVIRNRKSRSGQDSYRSCPLCCLHYRQPST